jgi:hypothetical protein
VQGETAQVKNKPSSASDRNPYFCDDPKAG